MARPKKIAPPTVAEAPDIRAGSTIARQPQLSTRYRRGRDNIFPQLTAAKLRRVLDGFRNGSLAEGAELFALMTERDHMLLNCRTQREKQVSRLEWAIVANDRASETDPKFAAQREFLTAFYNGVKAVDAYDRNKKGGLRLFLRQLMTAEAMGYSAHHLVWQPREDGTLGLMAEHVPLRFFENTTGELRYCPQGFEVEGQAMPEAEWLVHAGEGLMTAASILVHYKRGGMGAFVQFVDKFGVPALFLTTEAAPGSPEWQDAVAALEAFYNDWAAVFSKGSELKPVEPSNTGQSPHERLIDLCDRGLAILFRGGDLATLSNQKSHAGQGADLQQTSGQALLEDDAASVEDCLARLTEMALRWKFGPAAPVLATFQLVIPSPTEDAERLGNAKLLREMGAGIDANELAREMDFEVVDSAADAGGAGSAGILPAGAADGAMQGRQDGGAPSTVANEYDPNQPREAKGSEHGGQWVAVALTEEQKAADQKIGDAIESISTGKGEKEFFHGTFRETPVLHIGQTFADNRETADNYSGDATFHGAVSIEGLRIARVRGFDRNDSNWGAIGDSQSDIEALQRRGIDLIQYDDEDPMQRQHQAWRIVSEKALKRFQQTVILVANEATQHQARLDFVRDAAAVLAGARAADLGQLRLACLAAANASTDEEARRRWASLNARLPDFVSQTAGQEAAWADLIATCVANGAEGKI